MVGGQQSLHGFLDYILYLLLPMQRSCLYLVGGAICSTSKSPCFHWWGGQAGFLTGLVLHYLCWGNETRSDSGKDMDARTNRRGKLLSEVTRHPFERNKTSVV